MPDTDSNSNTNNSRAWTTPQKITKGATSCSTTLDNGCNLTKVTDVEGNERVYYGREPLNP